jgi:hypothetical protein
VVVDSDQIANEARGPRRVGVRAAGAAAVLALALVIAVVAAVGGFSSGAGHGAGRAVAPGSPTLPRLDASSSVVASGTSAVRGPWRLSASVGGGQVCGRLDFTGARNESPHVTGCADAAAATRAPGVLLTSAGTIGVLGIATSDVATVTAQTSDGQTATTVAVRGPAGSGVGFFAYPDLGISSGPTVYVAYDAGGHQLGQVGFRAGDQPPPPPPTAKPTASDGSPARG